ANPCDNNLRDCFGRLYALAMTEKPLIFLAMSGACFKPRNERGYNGCADLLMKLDFHRFR
ncbi:MAG: hypothetical protein IJU92_09955, partial [Spirochaetaceae bacterium]|nr:hypothetical protein [Spirochaetaceae bacterium]